MSRHRNKNGHVKTVSYSTNIPLDVDYIIARKYIDYFAKHSLKNAAVQSITDDISGDRYCFTVSNFKSEIEIEEVNIPITDIEI